MLVTFNSVPKDLERLENDFSPVKFFYFKSNINNHYISAFCCVSEKEKYIAEGWKKISSAITADYLLELGNSFERRNSYLLFICKETISKAVQYEIENNKFSMRKMVAFDIEEDINPDSIIDILNDKILSNQIDKHYLVELERAKNPKKNVDFDLCKISKELLNLNIPNDLNEESKEQRKLWLEDKLKG